MTSQGSAHGRFTRAIQTRNLWAAETAMREMQGVSLLDALDYLEILATQRPDSFFESVPAGGDLYLLKWILHDFDDAAAAQILRTIRDACAPEARLLVIERDLTDPETTLSDLQMLVILGGRERSQTEYSQLLLSSGFALTRSIRTEGPLSLLEALPI